MNDLDHSAENDPEQRRTAAASESFDVNSVGLIPSSALRTGLPGYRRGSSISLETWIPVLKLARTYDRRWLRNDLVAGISVAAVAIPIGIAYAELAGSPAVVGIYSCILPPAVYALFGSSRQLIVNPDAAACAIVAATVTPLALGDPARYSDLSVLLTLIVGLLCIVAGVARLGVIANFLSRPILTGYLNGIALSIICGQLGKLLGLETTTTGFFRTLAHVVSNIAQTHWPTLIVGLSLFVVLRALKHLAPRVPAPLVAAVLGIVLVSAFRLDQRGVRVVGPVPSGFLPPRIPRVAIADLEPLALGACSIVLVSFCSMMTTARGFALKNRYAIRANQDLVALGVCDLASGLSHGFVVSGADSRTAVADSSGGKTQVTALVAAASMALVLLFLTAPLAYLPTAALAAILISSCLGLFDFHSLRSYYRLSKPEFRHSVVAMLGVMTVGILPGILIAVTLALIRLLMLAANPHDAVLGAVPGQEGFQKIGGEADAVAVSGVIIYRFEAALVFFNADSFKERVLKLVGTANPRPLWFVFDAESSGFLDITAAGVLRSLHGELASQGVVLVIVRAQGLFRSSLQRAGVADQIGADYIFPTTNSAIKAFNERHASEMQLARAPVLSKCQINVDLRELK